MAFDYHSFVVDLGAKEEIMREKTDYTIDKKKLFAQDATIFQELYPEYREVFAKPHRCAYYHKEAADAVGHLGQFSTVMIRLPPFKDGREFIEYFGGSPHLMAEYIVNGKFLPLISNPRLYSDEQVRKVYEPIFKRIYLAGNQAIPVYENRLEDFLVRMHRRHETWEELVAEKTKEIGNKTHIDKIKVGRLVYKDPARFFAERIAYPEYRQQKRRSKAFMHLASNIARVFKGIKVSRQDLERKPSTPKFITHTDKVKYELLDIVQEKGLDQCFDRCSDLRSEFVERIKGGNIEDILRAQQLYFAYHQEIRQICKGVFPPTKDMSLKFIKVAVGPAMGLTALLAHPHYPEVGHVLLELIPEAYQEIQLLIDEFLPLAWDSLQERLYPIVGYDYVPTFHFWAVPALPSPEA